jgi:hypothetical protein
MKVKRLTFTLVLIATIMAMVGIVSADDGPMFRRNVSKTPDQETERANLNHMSFYVPAQSSDGTLLTEGIDYYAADGTTIVDTRYYAKPLVAVYIDGLPEEEEEDSLYGILSGAGFGAHDAYAAVSLDDGETWKRTNLSNSADLSSFTLANGHSYPGDAHNMTFAIAGDKVLVGWISKYCDGGSPAYTWDEDGDSSTEDDLLYPDLWGVAGSQRSVDYTLQGFPEVGEIPYSCVWAARGTLLEDPETGLYDILWTKAERLTSGRRDANRLEMNGDSAAGFMMTWQEDPDGLRPGQGLGPGEGWSGAVVNQQTDLWYSYISIEDFDLVDDDADYTTGVNPISISDYEGDNLPKVAAPMALPVRLTDNRMCKTAKGAENTESEQFPYCFADFSTDPPTLYDSPNENSTFCSSTVIWTTPGGSDLTLCVAQDGRVLQGRVGASRPRVNVQPYDSDGDGVYDSAWVIMGAEESKALGEGSTEEDVEPEDIGKNMWYYTFDILNPDVVMQGGMLNQPAVDPETGTFFELLEDDFGNDFYETEIARRFSHFSQPIHQIGDAGVSAVLIVKQGIINQGGPADIFLRRLVVPDDVWVDCPADSPYDRCLPPGYNPYAYENMACDEWVYTTDGTAELPPENPRYVQGLCLSNMINMSGGTIVSCDNGTSGADCATAFPWNGQDDISEDGFPKVTEWVQTEDDLDDQSWENPYDVAKGHRGFIDGDFIMMMYAWSPNWQANSVGNDHYNLYARRSFDGGLTWTTTPAELGGDGTETCENYKNGSEITTVCTTYGPGEFEQSRNLSQLVGNRETILDPRYTPTGGIKMLPITDLKGIGFTGYDDDVRDPSKFFIVYETGDNTTVAEGEAVPLDLFYSRATNWGDDYDLVEYYNDTTGETEEGFDWLEHDREDLSGEAANTCNNAGTFYYAIWNQWQEDEHENVSDSDAIFRRIMYLENIEADPTAMILGDLPLEVEEGSDEILTFVGTGKDNDQLGQGGQYGRGIDGYKWLSDLNGLLSEGQVFDIPVKDLIKGLHTIYFSVQDDEGNWSEPDTVTIGVGVPNISNKIYLPICLR